MATIYTAEELPPEPAAWAGEKAVPVARVWVGLSFALLTKHKIALNGIVLVSPYFDVVSACSGLRLDEPYINYLPAYAATAWYHKALANRPAELGPFPREAEKFAEEVPAPALFRGRRASASERRQVLEGLARFTGISPEYWEKANLRLDENRFAQEPRRERGVVIGRVDSRFQSGNISRLVESARSDPFDTAIAPAVAAGFNDYYRQDLKVESGQQDVISGDLEKKVGRSARAAGPGGARRRRSPTPPWICPAPWR